MSTSGSQSPADPKMDTAESSPAAQTTATKAMKPGENVPLLTVHGTSTSQGLDTSRWASNRKDEASTPEASTRASSGSAPTVAAITSATTLSQAATTSATTASDAATEAAPIRRLGAINYQPIHQEISSIVGKKRQAVHPPSKVGGARRRKERGQGKSSHVLLRELLQKHRDGEGYGGESPSTPKVKVRSLLHTQLRRYDIIILTTKDDLTRGDSPNDSKEPINIYKGFSGQRDVNPQSASFVIRKNQCEVRLRTNNLSFWNPGSTERRYVARDMTIENPSTDALPSHILGHLGTTTLPIEDYEHISKWETIKDAERPGLLCTTFRTSGEFWLDAKPTDTPKVPDVDKFLEDLNSGPRRVMIIRKAQHGYAEIDDHWHQLLDTCKLRGTWWFYREQIAEAFRNNDGSRFTAWINDTSKELKQQSGMKLRTELGKMQKYASHKVKRSFGERDELEIIQSCALLGELLYENKERNAYFGFGCDNFHTATIQHLNKGTGFVRFAVQFKKAEYFVIPKVLPDTNFKVRLHDPVTSTKAAPSTQAKADVEMGGTQQQFKGPEFKTKSGGIEPHPQDNFNFVMSGHLTPPSLAKNYVSGQKFRVELEYNVNTLPMTRMLQAIGKLSKTPGKSKGAGNSRLMQRFLLGKPTTGDMDLSKGRSLMDIHRLTAEDQEALKIFVDEMNLNDRQLAAWNHVFYEPAFVTQCQGPPGTGTTRVGAGVVNTFAFLHQSTLATAPSNVATDNLFVEIMIFFEKFKRICIDKGSDRHKKIRLMYFPTMATLKVDIKNLKHDKIREDQIAEQIATDAIFDSQGGSKDFDQYKLWTYIRASFKSTAESSPSNAAEKTAKDEAQKWLATYDCIKTGGKVQSGDHKKFANKAKVEMCNIFRDKNITWIIVSTCSNSAQLADINLSVQALLIDEAGFGTEPDSCVPLSLGPYRVCIVGDHMQLKPHVHSRSYQELDKQLGTSLFERFFGHPSVPLFVLKENYRMHPDISQYPGMSTYGYLECAPSTSVESPEYQLVKEFWFSEENRLIRQARLPPAFGKSSSERENQIRRMIFVPQDGFSSHRIGSTSLVNYSNINIVCTLVERLAIFPGDPDRGIMPLDLERVLILSPYKDSVAEINRQIHIRLSYLGGADITHWPTVMTIDSTQGGQSEIVILELTPANQYHGSIIGFLAEWNRINVAITRAKSIMWIIGNLNAWRSELRIIYEGIKSKKLALLIMDLIDLGDIVEVKVPSVLPANIKEYMSLNEHPHESAEKHWTRRMEPAAPRKLSTFLSKFKDADADDRDKFEKKLLKQLEGMRKSAAKMQADSAANPTKNFGDIIEEADIRMEGGSKQPAEDGGENLDDDEDEDGDEDEDEDEQMDVVTAEGSAPVEEPAADVTMAEVETLPDAREEEYLDDFASGLENIMQQAENEDDATKAMSSLNVKDKGKGKQPVEDPNAMVD